MIRTRDDLIRAIDALPIPRIAKKTYYISVNNGYLIDSDDITGRVWTLNEFDTEFKITDPILAEIEDVSTNRRSALAERNAALHLSSVRADATNKLFGGGLVPSDNTRTETDGSKRR
jgi:hypothetical protein